MKKEFKNEQFNELCEFMDRMDSSDDYIMVNVSALFKNNEEKVEMFINLIGKTDGEKIIKADITEAILLHAMFRNDGLKELITNAAWRFETFEASMKRRKS